MRAEQVRTLHRSASVALPAALVGAILLCGVLIYIDAQSTRSVTLWMALVATDFIVREGLCLAYRRRQPPPERWAVGSRRFTLATLFGGLVWGVGAVFLMTPDTTEQLLVMLVVSATASGAIPAFGSWLPATYS